MVRHRTLGIVIVFVSLPACQAYAQSTAQTAASSFADLHGRLKLDQTVCVETAAIVDEHAGGIKGHVLELSGSSLRLLVNGQHRAFSERDVLVVSERHTSAGKGAVIGLAVGAGLGLLFDRLVIATIGSDRRFRQGDGLLTGIVAGCGAIAGAHIGRLYQHQQILFLAPDVKGSHPFTITPFVGEGQKGLAAAFRF
jgi:hypothetical protein